MIKYLDNLSERALVDRFYDFVSIGYVVSYFIMIELTIVGSKLLLGLGLVFVESSLVYVSDVASFFCRLGVEVYKVRWSMDLAYSILDLSKKVYPFVLGNFIDFILR